MDIDLVALTIMCFGTKNWIEQSEYIWSCYVLQYRSYIIRFLIESGDMLNITWNV